MKALRKTTSDETSARYLELSTKRAARAVSVRKTFWREYRSWIGAKERCYNENEKNYALYGGRGIRVCDSWRRSFQAFLDDMGPRPAGMTLERKDGNGNYEPSNCRWATRAEQSRNTCRTKLTPDLVVRIRRAISAGWSVVDVARELGVSPGVISCVNTGKTWKDV